MEGILREVAIQLKGNLAFLLGLGGMFTTMKALLTSIFILPRIESDRPSIGRGARKLRRWLYWLAALSALCFVLAAWLYFSSAVGSIDAGEVAANRARLTIDQQRAVGGLILLAAAIVLAEAASSVLRFKLTLLAAEK